MVSKDNKFGCLSSIIYRNYSQLPRTKIFDLSRTIPVSQKKRDKILSRGEFNQRLVQSKISYCMSGISSKLKVILRLAGKS